MHCIYRASLQKGNFASKQRLLLVCVIVSPGWSPVNETSCWYTRIVICLLQVCNATSQKKECLLFTKKCWLLHERFDACLNLGQWMIYNCVPQYCSACLHSEHLMFSNMLLRSWFGTNLVDPASSHMLVSKIKPCMSQYKLQYGKTVNGSLKQL